MATFRTEKSFVMKEYARQENAIVTKMNCACAVGRAIATNRGMPLAAPINGRVACVNASMSARISANCPISGIINILAGATGAQASSLAFSPGRQPGRLRSSLSYLDNVFAASFAEFFTLLMSLA